MPTPQAAEPSHREPRRLRIFIGSSSEAAELVDEVAAMLEGMGHSVLAWNDPGAFPPGSFTLPRLREICREVDAAILILGNEDATWYRGALVGKSRDNVILEYGLFAGALGEERTIVCQVGDPSRPTDLAGMTVINFSRVRDAKLRIGKWLHNFGAISAAQVVQGGWIKLSSEGWHHSVRCFPDHTFLERQMFGDATHRGTWRLDNGILRLDVGGYQLSVFPSSDGRYFRGLEVIEGQPESGPYPFVVIHVPYVAGP